MTKKETTTRTKKANLASPSGRVAKNKKTVVKKKTAGLKSAKKKIVTKDKAINKIKKVKKVKKEEVRDKRYFEAVGRRKASVARVRLFTIKPFEGEEGRIIVNEKKYKEYFPTLATEQIIESALRRLKSLNRFELSIKVSGGGFKTQAEAIRHGIARTLVKFNPDFRKKLRRSGFLTRDSRVKERKKFGLKKARRAPQWSKR